MNEKKQIKAYWHVYHNRLLDFSEDINERIEYIRRCKPTDEVFLRLDLLKEVRGILPEELVKAGKAWWKAYKAYKNEYLSLTHREESLLNATRTFGEADTKLIKVSLKYRQEIEDLHEEECPNCPWNGWTIFPYSQ